MTDHRLPTVVAGAGLMPLAACRPSGGSEARAGDAFSGEPRFPTGGLELARAR